MVRRRTTQEVIVFKAIEVLGHSTVEQLISYIKINDSNISLASIYRNLNKLESENMIIRFKCGDLEVYETVKEKHYHYICRDCGAILDIKPSSLPIDLGALTKINRNTISDCDLVLYGVCHSCKKRNKKGENKNEEVCM